MNVFDPSKADTAAGFTYSYDFDNDGIFEIFNGTSPTATIPASYLSTSGPAVIHGRITDKDGFFTEYTTTIQVIDTAPASVAPAITIYSAAAGPITATAYDSSSGAGTSASNTLLDQGQWLGFHVDFGALGIQQATLQLRAVAAKAGVKIVMRLDDPNGQQLASFSRAAAARRGQKVRAFKATGIHTLYLVVLKGQANINWFSFVPIVARHPLHHSVSA